MVSEKTLQAARLLHTAFLATIFMFILCIHLAAPAERSVSPIIPIAFTCVAIGDIGVGFVRRRMLMAKVTETFERECDVSKALEQWRIANIASFVHAETVALFGVALKFLGASWKIASPFFFVGFALLLLWMPKLDLPAESRPPTSPLTP